MCKRILALLLFPLMIFCGCDKTDSEPRLTVEEYKTEMEEAIQKYNDAQDGISKLLHTAEDSSDVVPFLRESASELQGYCALEEESYVQFESIRPPEEFEEIHGDLLKCIPNEREWLESVKAIFEAETSEEYEESAQYAHDILFATSTLESVPWIYKHTILEKLKTMQ